MKKIILNLFFFILCVNSYASKNYKIYVIPLSSASQKMDVEKVMKEKNKKLLFVTTWCSRCKTKMKEIEENNLTEDYIYIFGNYGRDNREKVSAFLKTRSELKYTFFDENNILKEHFNVKIVPFEVDLQNI